MSRSMKKGPFVDLRLLGRIEAMNEAGSCFAIIPPVTALLESKVTSREVIAFPEEGMEAFHRLYVHEFPVIIGAVHGKTIDDEEAQA